MRGWGVERYQELYWMRSAVHLAAANMPGTLSFIVAHPPLQCHLWMQHCYAVGVAVGQ